MRLVQRLVLAFLLTAILLVVGLALLAASLQALNRDQKAVTGPLFEASRAGYRYYVAMLDQETGLRGFIIDGQESSLQPYLDGQADQQAEAASLHDQLDKYPSLAAPLAAMEQAAARWSQEFAEPLLAQLRAGGDGSLTAEQQELGRGLFDDVRERREEFGDEIVATRADAVQRVDRARERVTWLFIAAVVLLVAAAGLLAWALRSWVLRPLRDLSREVDEVASGDIRHPITLGGPPDLVEVAEDVEVMRQRLVAEFEAAEAAAQAVEVQRAQLQVQADELLRSNAELEQFAYVASHDLQEPLRKIASFTDLLQRRYGGQLDERADQYIAFASDGARRMQRLINDLLGFSRVGRTTGEFTDVSLDACLATAWGNLQVAAEDADATLTQDPLPEVRGDGGLLTQALQNLLSNALKFRRPDVPLKVHVGCNVHDGLVDLSVSDNGIGIPPEYAEKVFVIFQRLHRREDYEGTGIGLALVKKIVEFHHGTVSIDSAPGEGTTFLLSIPLADVPATPVSGIDPLE